MKLTMAGMFLSVPLLFAMHAWLDTIAKRDSYGQEAWQHDFHMFSPQNSGKKTFSKDLNSILENLQSFHGKIELRGVLYCFTRIFGVLEACEDARFIMGMLEGRWLADSDDAGEPKTQAVGGRNHEIHHLRSWDGIRSDYTFPGLELT